MFCKLGVFLKKYLQLLIGLAVSAFFIYLALPGLHLPDVIEALQTLPCGSTRTLTVSLPWRVAFTRSARS